MCTVNISDILNGRNYPDAGVLLFDTITKAIDTDERIILDMKGVDILPSMFLNPSIGRLLKERGREVMTRFTFRNITQAQMNGLRSYVAKVE